MLVKNYVIPLRKTRLNITRLISTLTIVFFLESSIEMVVLRRRQVACIRMGLFTFLIGAGLVFVYHYVDNNDYQKQMEDAISILERDTSKFFIQGFGLEIELFYLQNCEF